MQEKYFFQDKVQYCEICSIHKLIPLECEHELIPVKMIIEGGNYQVRIICKNCYYIDPKPKKAIDYPQNIPIKKLDDFHIYVFNHNQPLRDFLQSLRMKRELSFREVYDNYMKSPEWLVLRLKVLERDEYTCQICQKAATEVHHLTYKHLTHEYLFELISLCSECHKNEYHPELIK